MFFLPKKINRFISLQTLVAGFAIFVFSILGTFLLQDSALAKMDAETSPTTRAVSYSYWKATSKCVRDHMRGTIYTKDGEGGSTTPTQGGGGGLEGTKDGEWFDDLTAYVVVYPDGKLDCDQVLVKALKLWGWNDNAQFLKDLGYKFDLQKPAWVRNNDSGDARFEAFKKAVLSKVGNVVDMFNANAQHIAFTELFMSSKQSLSQCSAKRVTNPDATQKNAAKNNETRGGLTYVLLDVVNGKIVEKDVVFTYKKETSTTTDTGSSSTSNYASVWNYRGSNYAGGTGEVYKCSDLIKKINSTAASLAEWNSRFATPGQEEGSGNECTGDTCNSPGGSTDEPMSSCTIDGIGWILCPVVNFLNGIVDAAYNFVASLLEVQPLMTTGNTGGAYEAWQVMRTIANVAFVISFLIIIFSQLTGVGVSNYGIKKLLPRLVISAILVNISFFICAIAVDLSNIAGASMRDIFANVGASMGSPDANNTEWNTGDNTFTAIWGTLIALGVTGGIVFYAGLSFFIPAVIAAGLAIATVFLVLVFRQALIILLVVISPIAFVAFLLPNTENLFTKWRKLLTTLLLMFPIIAAIFGASALASQIVMASAQGDFKIFVQIMGACIAILPLAITPIVMKTAGGVLNRFAGFVNNPNRGPVDRLRKAGAAYANTRKNMRNTRALNGEGQLGRGAFVRWRARRNTVGSMAESEAKRANTEYIADQLQNDSKFAQAAAGGRAANAESIMRVTASAISSADKLDSEEVSATNVVLKNAELSQVQIRSLALGGSVTTDSGKTFDASKSLATQRAAMQQMVASNDVEGMNQAWNNSAVRNSSELRSTFADALQSSSARPGYFSQGAIAGLRQAPNSDNAKVAPLNVDTAIENAIKAGAYSPEKIATADKDDLAQIVRVMKTSKNLTDDQKQAVMLNAEVALSDSKLGAVIGKNKEQVLNIRDFNPNEGATLNVRTESTAANTSSESPTIPMDRQ